MWYNPKMKIIAASDFHGTLPEIPECDLLIVGGDVCPVWNHDLDYQASWLFSEFWDWLVSVPAKRIVGVAGNHDFILQEKPELGRKLPWHYLENELIVLPGEHPLRIWGSPMSNKYGSWAFMAKEDALRDLWATIPRDIDILITHGPAWGVGDEVVGFSATKRGMLEPEHVGSRSLANFLAYEDWPNLQAHIFGHIHEGYGRHPMPNYCAYNVAHMNDEYNPLNPPLEIKWL